jgi:hypothetical protein
MDFKILLLLVLFNLVVAYFKRRAKKKKEMEARIGADHRTDHGAGASVSTAADEVSSQKQVMQKREAPSWASQHERDEVEQDWDERNSSDFEDEDSENPYRETTRPMPTPMKPDPQPQSAAKKPTPETGKDLFSQLAKELGLEIPQRPRPTEPNEANQARTPVPTPSQSRQTYPGTLTKSPGNLGSKGSVTSTATTMAAAEAALRNKRATAGYDDHSRTVADSAPGADLTSAPGIAAVESANASAYVTRDSRRSAALSALRSDLFDSESLQRAFILKTVLDRPLSLKAHVPGHGAAE